MSVWVPADRFLAIVDGRGKPYVGKQSTLGRALLRIRSGEQKFVSLDTADRILIDLGLDHYWHISQEDGGLADIYEDGAQYGNPHSRAGRRVYATEEARLAALRKTSRESKRRAKLDPVRLERMRSQWRESKRRAA